MVGFRSSTQPTTGYAESDRDFISKRAIALKEAKKTRYWLKLLVKSEMMPEDKILSLVDECE
ncbi:four helix bundle protein [Nostoc sp.]|uniref:four helix bundle protein n=1 Tax=Nostoc sp. TaxID=1180 RepID=UPI002FF583F4